MVPTKKHGEPLHSSPALLAVLSTTKLQRRALSLSSAALGGGLAFFKVEEISDGFKFSLFKAEISPHAMSYYCKKLKSYIVKQNHGPSFHSEKTQA